MRKTIWKYGIGETLQDVTLEMPCGAVVRSVANQRDHLVLWAEVDMDKAHTESRTFAKVLTGGQVPDGRRFIGTVLLDQGSDVLHVYEVE